MKTIKEKTAVETETTIYKFEASIGDYHRILTIKDGKILQVGCCVPNNECGYKRYEPDFVDECYSTIIFIVNHNPKELKNIYNALADGEMKEFCRKLQQKKLAELDF